MYATRESRDSTSGPGRDAGQAVGTADFDLLRYFSLACLAVFVVVTVVMCTGFYHISKRYIRLDTEQRSVQVAERLAPLVFGDGKAVPAPGTPEFARLDRQMRDLLKPLGIFKINIYDPTGRVLYTTDRRVRVGRLGPLHNNLREALAGRVVSKLQTRVMVGHLEAAAEIPRAVVETNAPIRNRLAGHDVQGVLEVYQDVTGTYDRLPGVIALIVGASVGAMSTLYAILYLVVRKAHRIIRNQTHTIKQAKADIENYASQLEQRVEERTRQLHDTLAQQGQDEKMVATGTLAAGIAHELNTPLASILGSVQLVLDHCAETLADASDANQASQPPNACQQCLEDLRRVESEAKRCKKIIRNLLGFSRKSDGERSCEDLGELVARSISLIGPEAWQCGVRVEMCIDDDLPPVRVNGNEIQQVLVNIMDNGIAAMPQGGTLAVRLSRQDRTARITIHDTGQGINHVTLPRIFEPFFTTKEVGKGTGLGLSISYRIIKDHGGTISVTSAVGEGSTFVVELPVEAATPRVSSNLVTRPRSGPIPERTG